MCEIKSGLMKGRVRLSESAGRRKVKKEKKTTAIGGEVCVGKECWVGKEGRHAALCASSKERQIARLREKKRSYVLALCAEGGPGERARKSRPAFSRVILRVRLDRDRKREGKMESRGGKRQRLWVGMLH